MNKKQWLIICLVMILVLICGKSYTDFKFIKLQEEHERTVKDLQNTILDLSSKINSLNITMKTLTEPRIDWSEETYNYLAIGNSITKHNTCSYWWNEVGMAASDAEHDYFHLVVDYLKSINNQVDAMTASIYTWEVQSHDRDETLVLLDNYLSPELDLITVQLGENVSDVSTYQEDSISLLNHIKEKAPNARILVLQDFWSTESRNDLKLNAVNEVNVEYVSLNGIADNSEYYCGIGTIVYDADGIEHIVNHEGVAKHPGDNGMKAIAERIIDTIKR